MPRRPGRPGDADGSLQDLGTTVAVTSSGPLVRTITWRGNADSELPIGASETCRWSMRTALPHDEVDGAR
jgi:hypothetical protein